MRKTLSFFLVLLIISLGFIYALLNDKPIPNTNLNKTVSGFYSQKNISRTKDSNPLAITEMQDKSYPGSNITIEQTLVSGSNYNRYLVSYLSDGLKIYGLLTIPDGQKPKGGLPVILLNHGYIPPASYSTDSSYSVMVDPFAANGYIVFKPDFRGNGNSHGTAMQPYVSPGYITDSMNALSSIKKYKDANPNKIGVFGHSMGGDITLHELLIAKDIKAAVIASGVVGSYSDLLSWWDKREATGVLTTQNDLQTLQLVKKFVQDHGTPQNNESFYAAIDPTYYIFEINTPVLFLVGTSDQVVPPDFSSSLRDRLEKAGKIVTFQEFPGADHNLSPDTEAAMSEALTFFNQHLR